MTPELLVPVGAIALIVPVVATPLSASKVTEALCPTLTLTRSASLMATRARIVERSEISTALLLEDEAEAADAPDALLAALPSDWPFCAFRIVTMPETGAVTVRLPALSSACERAVLADARLARAEETPSLATATCCRARVTARESMVGFGFWVVAVGCCAL